MKTLPEIWVDQYHKKAAALANLNKTMGTNYRTSRLYEWLNGMSIPKPVRAYMRKQISAKVFHGEGVKIDQPKIDRILAKLL